MNLSKYTLILVLLLSTATAVTLAEKKPDRSVLNAERYAVQIDGNENSFKINNVGEYALYPEITLGGNKLNASTDVTNIYANESVGSTSEGYTIEYPEQVVNEVFVNTQTTFGKEKVTQTISLENTGSESVTASLDLSKAEGNFSVYFPYSEREKDNYLLISENPNNITGSLTLVRFENQPPTYPPTNLKENRPNLLNVLTWNLNIEPDETEQIEVTYSSAVVSDPEEGDFSYPSEKTYLRGMEPHPLFTINRGSVIEEKTPPTPPQISGSGMLDKINETVHEETSLSEKGFEELPEEVGLSGEVTSLERAIIFREMAKEKNIPSQIVIGWDGEEYYAWTEAFAGNVKRTYMEPDEELDTVYKAPKIEYCNTENLGACPWSKEVSKFEICVGRTCISVIWILAFMFLSFIALIVLIQYKTKFLYKLIRTQTRETSLETVEGEYKIIEEEFEPEKPVEEFTFQELKKRGGDFDPAEYAKESPYSEILIESTIEKLVDDRVLKKIG